ncbi:hypothetical protein O3G_MSEX011468 [Manduca sexta]|uniref:Uncharacterized protein n=1 Tax=Manduca sexta TaxID=7130 RepID=A0A921ZKJ0_MANSE|nr:hypothetical protein O3G_MSEX011468 [Manduca sexta]
MGDVKISCNNRGLTIILLTQLVAKCTLRHSKEGLTISRGKKNALVNISLTILQKTKTKINANKPKTKASDYTLLLDSCTDYLDSTNINSTTTSESSSHQRRTGKKLVVLFSKSV